MQDLHALTKQKREILGTAQLEAFALPNLISVQLESFERFLQRDRVTQGKPCEIQGLELLLRSVFPVERSDGIIRLEYLSYSIDTEKIKYSAEECRRSGYTYAVPIRIRVNLVFQETGEIRQKDVYIGDFPLMTQQGTFVINGAERVVVSQIHRSPGVISYVESGVFMSRIIPYRGTWLEFEVDTKTNLIYTRIDRKRKTLAITLIRAMGFKSSEDIINHFYQVKKISINNDEKQKSQMLERLVGQYIAEDIQIASSFDTDQSITFFCGQKIHPQDAEEILRSTVDEISVVDLSHPDSLHSDIILNSIEVEHANFEKESNPNKDYTLYEAALLTIVSIITPSKVTSVKKAEEYVHSAFFSQDNYDLGDVGRYKLNKRFNYANPTDARCLLPSDLIHAVRYLVQVYIGKENIDDIDHLSNRRIRTVGEMFFNHIKNAMLRVERIATDRMNTKDITALRPQEVISIKPIVNAINEFFGLSQLSQFMDQVNPLAGLTHKRRLNALGPGGLTRERAKFEVRDVHYTHYGRICPIETPEGPNIGLIVSLANYARVNEYGFLESPYRKVDKSTATSTIHYLSAIDEERYFIAQADAELKKDGSFVQNEIAVRKAGEFSNRSVNEIQYMDVSPRQIVSISTSLIPFLEHDDANRALMGSNMQRQAVPLLFPESPYVGTGMEAAVAYDSGAIITAKTDGTVSYVSASKIIIENAHHAKKHSLNSSQLYSLTKFQRSNQDTCLHQRPLVKMGQTVRVGDIIADGTSIEGGELALGRNVLVGFMSWHGYNYEDAILISERVVRDDVFTSVHIKEFTIEIRETKLGPEKITCDIPNTSAEHLAHLDEEGIAHVGARLSAGSILVGRVTPKSETENTPEFRLLNSIFGEKAKEVRDTSLRLPHGVEGTVVSVRRVTRDEENNLHPGVIELLRVLVASKRKLKEGDKMAGRHGNKGVVARVLPIEDMPYLADGTALDVCLSPLGLPSRMNLGQILETQLGWAAYKLNKKYATPVFESPSEEQIQQELQQANLPQNSKAVVYDGLSGEPMENTVTVGYTYLLKLHHLVDDKMHARSTGPYSLVTQQPLGGKAQFGGQRFGEMEVWALEAYGAANTLQELLTIKSDDMQGRTRIYENIVKSEPLISPGIPESFNVLVQELRGLGLNLSIYDEKNQKIALTERDEELISREGFDF